MKLSNFLHRGFLAALILSLTVLSLSQVMARGGGDTPGDGYDSEDHCGYMMGGNSEINFDAMTPADQACLNVVGGGALTAAFFEAENEKTSQMAWVTGNMLVDLAPNVSPSNLPQVNLETGKWSGYALAENKMGEQFWLWFDWECQDAAAPKGGVCAGQESSYHVTTDFESGMNTGYAWSDEYGYVNFEGTGMEAPPMVLVPEIEILANGGTMTPSEVLDSDSARDDAPQANGADYWAVSLKLRDVITGEYLESSDVKGLSFNLNLDEQVFENQVENVGDALEVATWNPYLGCNPKNSFCLDETGGEARFQTFVRSYSPTSNMLWMNDNDLVDRDGCIGIYHESPLVRGCGKLGNINPTHKWNYFEGRSAGRNYVNLDTLEFDLELTQGRDFVIFNDGNVTSKSIGHIYDLSGLEDSELSFAPRFTMEEFYAYYESDGLQWSEISTDENEQMELNAVGTKRPFSQVYVDSAGSQDKMEIIYQLDVDTVASDPSNSDNDLVFDPTMGGQISDYADNTTNYVEGNFTQLYDHSILMGYGQTEEKCAGDACGNPTNISYSDPTAEAWVCDEVQFPQSDPHKSCYYVGYLPIVDRFAGEYGPVMFEGSTSDFFGQSFTDTDAIYSGGAQETIRLRNQFYETGARLTQGLATTGSGTLNLATGASTGHTLLDGTLHYFEAGDVTVLGSDSFTSGTLFVKGGDVYIDSNIGSPESRLGIFVLQNDAGHAGNVYISPDVTELFVNIVADGSVFADSGTFDADGYPLWTAAAPREATLVNQLYLNGSMSARMVFDASGDNCGRGTVTTEQVMECSLADMRKLPLCYGLDATGMIDATLREPCPDTEMSEYGEEYAQNHPSGPSSTEAYPGVILDYAAPGALPIFTSTGRY